MSPGRTSAVLVAAAAVALAGCPTPELELRPFRIDIRVAGAPATLAEGLPEPARIDLSGAATRISDTELAVADATLGDVRITFRNDAAPDVVFPASLQGETVFVTAVGDPTARLPDGSPLRFPGFRVAVGTPADLRHRFLLGESTAASGFDTGVVPFPLARLGEEDFPVLFIQVDWLDFEPQDCGVVYHDFLGVALPGADEATFLGRGGRVDGLLVGAFEGPWTVHHVQSWHRTGDCPDDAPAFSQMAAWR